MYEVKIRRSTIDEKHAMAIKFESILVKAIDAQEAFMKTEKYLAETFKGAETSILSVKQSCIVGLRRFGSNCGYTPYKVRVIYEGSKRSNNIIVMGTTLEDVVLKIMCNEQGLKRLVGVVESNYVDFIDI